MLKKYVYMLTLLAAAFGFAACTEDGDYSPANAEDGARVFFSQEATTDFTLTATTASVDVPVIRNTTEGVLEASISATFGSSDYASLFTVPSTILFEEGKNEATVTISFDRSKLADGASYEITINLVDETIFSNYGAASQKITLTIPEPYVYLGTGLYREDIVTTFFSFNGDEPNPEWEVEIYENTKNPGFLYLKNGLTKDSPVQEPGDYVEEDVYFTIDVRDPNKVQIPQQALGFDWGYGMFYARSIVDGTFKDGVITFPAKGLVVAMLNYNNGGFYYSNSAGMFRVVMPGIEITDYAMEVAYNGMSVAADNKTTEALFKGTYGADVASFKYYFVEDDVTDAAAQIPAAIEAGALEADGEVELETGLDEEDRVFEFSDGGVLEAPGNYTVVVVPCNADGEMQPAELALAAFYYAGIGASELPAATVKAKLFPVSVLYGSAVAAQYPDHTSIAPLAMGENVASARYGLVSGLTLNGDLEGPDGYDCLDYVCSALGKTPDAFLAGKLDAKGLADLNNPDMGWATIFNNLRSNAPVAFFIEVANEAGQTAIYVTGGKTAADPAAAAAVPATGSGVLKPHFEVVTEKLNHVML